MPDLTREHLEVFAFDPHRASGADVKALALEVMALRARVAVADAAIGAMQTAHESQLTRLAKERARLWRKVTRLKGGTAEDPPGFVIGLHDQFGIELDYAYREIFTDETAARDAFQCQKVNYAASDYRPYALKEVSGDE
ncbi:hypothetical protein OG225_42490 (plasmid) [Nocardia sp. NBC_01377]|uniref:hypothetical protein n=1 Tax=Nocardia sp. NBC_01377 TaxID=2903595 RepID=UPI002F913F95